MKLKGLSLCCIQITDAGCAALAASLDRGALPALKELELRGIPASAAAKADVEVALKRSKRARDRLLRGRLPRRQSLALGKAWAKPLKV